MQNQNEPTLNELCIEAQSVMHRLVALNDGRVSPDQILLAGMFFGTIARLIDDGVIDGNKTYVVENEQ